MRLKQINLHQTESSFSVSVSPVLGIGTTMRFQSGYCSLRVVGGEGGGQRLVFVPLDRGRRTYHQGNKPTHIQGTV